MQNIILLIFLSTYLLFVLIPSKRTIVALISAIIFLFLSWFGYKEFIFYEINWDVIKVLVGTLLVSNLITESGIAEEIAEKIILKTKSVKWSVLLLCIICGFLSIFLDNVSTLIIIAPIALQIAKKLNINPTDIIFALAISSNLQGTATLIGDPPSMILASAVNMNFLDFFFYKSKPSIFFAIELGAISSFFVLIYLFNNYNFEITNFKLQAKAKSWIPFYILALMILSLVFVSIFKVYSDDRFLSKAGIICLFFGLVALLVKKFILKTSIIGGIKLIDWETIIFLISIFIIIEILEVSGWIEKFGSFLVSIVGENGFIIYTLFVLSAVIISGFVDNIPFFATMVPIAKVVSSQTGVSLILLLFGLLIGCTLGGNITPIGASANVVAWGILKKEKCKATFLDFVKIGLPFTFAAVLPTYFFIWFFWK